MFSLLMDFLVELSETGYIFAQLTIDFLESILILMTISAKSAFNVWALVFGMTTLFLTILIKSDQCLEDSNQSENTINIMSSTDDLLPQVKEGSLSLESAMYSSLPPLERHTPLDLAIFSP